MKSPCTSATARTCPLWRETCRARAEELTQLRWRHADRSGLWQCGVECGTCPTPSLRSSHRRTGQPSRRAGRAAFSAAYAGCGRATARAGTSGAAGGDLGLRRHRPQPRHLMIPAILDELEGLVDLATVAEQRESASVGRWPPDRPSRRRVHKGFLRLGSRRLGIKLSVRKLPVPEGTGRTGEYSTVEPWQHWQCGVG
jgi:hypothetical protein